MDSGLTITEPATEVIWPVDFNFADQEAGQGELYSNEQCYANNVVIVEDSRQIDYVAPYAIPSIEQSDYTDRVIKVNVTIVNNGNHPLYNVEFQLDPAGWNNFRNPRFFWEDIYMGASYDTISDTIDVFAVGDEVTFTIEVIVANDIPIGEHRLPILYRGYYFDDGALLNPTGFFPINGGDDLVVLFSIAVTDSVIQCHVSDVTTNAGDKDNIVAETIEVTLVNDEGYNFIDVMVRANFTGTPWYMPVINMRNPLVWADNANAPMPYAAWDAHDDMDLVFTVDTDPNMTPDTYPFSLEVTAVIEESLEIVSVVVDYTQGAVIYYEGYGPQIQVTAFTTNDIIPGQEFNMTLTIENVGDETLRDVWIYVDSDTTEEYDWDLEQEFKEQFDWSSVFEDWGSETGGQVTWNGEFPEDMFYTVEDLDVDNIREIVEINLYMDGVYSMPGAKITAVKIIDLAPGASFDVTYDMLADKDMVNGKPYAIEVYFYGVDPYGDSFYNYEEVTVMSSLPGDSYNPVELNWFDAGLKALALFLFFIIVLAILLFVYNMFKGEPYDEDDEDFDFEDEPEEPAAPAEAPQQELVEP
jgi:cbb3-type cytochrome oxidase subunit 3